MGLVMVEQHRVSAGIMKNGELWYPVTKYAQSTYAPPCESRIVRLDLKTGERRETGLKLPEVKRRWEAFNLIWMGEHLYVVDSYASTPEVYRATESGLERYTALPAKEPASEFYEVPFFYHGQFTVIKQDHTEGFRLAHLVNGTWEKGRRIRLPRTNAQWITGPQGAQIHCDAEPPPNGIRCYLTVIPDDTEMHIRFVTQGSRNQLLFAAYRQGFEYVDDGDPASAQSPENTEFELSGWEQINSTLSGAIGWGAFRAEQDGVLLGIQNNQRMQFVRRIADGQWKVLSGLELSPSTREWDSLITGPSERSYVLRQSSEWWDRFTFYPIDGDTIGPAQLTLPGHEQMYLNRWGRCAGGLFLAWVTHIVVLICGQRCCHSSPKEYEFGLHKAYLAPPPLRGLAFAIDAMAMLLLVATSFSIQWHYLDVKWDRNADQKISQLLSHAEMNIDSRLVSWLNVVDSCILDPKEFIGRPRDFEQFRALILTVLIDTLLPLWLYRTYHEGKSGVTFGKWLTGIRTVRSTLRPCGYARAVARSAMYLVDFALFITPLPATISMLLSPCCQRLGDRVGDTLVIKSR
ncbi:RDD family protein [Schlesneria paludicola]|uniref:RDD family protein n=1 Tax=Schlesneria paludicola TaxID=360056 RepID=UPI0002F15AC8|nr:RDD family protein [Schlesneria paludicola]